MPLAVRADEYVSLERKQVEFVVWDLVPRPGLTILAGKPKAGKSWLALQLAQSVARGTPFLGRDTIRGRVLYFILESEMVWHHRLRKLKHQGWNVDCDLFIPHPDVKPLRVNVLERESRQWIHTTIEEVNPDLIIFDPLREMHNAEEDSSTEEKIVGDHITVLTEGRATVIIHHAKKLAKDNTGRTILLDPIDSLRGSSYLGGKADAVWLLFKENDNAPTGTLFIAPRFADREIINLVQNRQGLWQVAAAPKLIVERVTATEPPETPLPPILELPHTVAGLPTAPAPPKLPAFRPSRRAATPSPNAPAPSAASPSTPPRSPAV